MNAHEIKTLLADRIDDMVHHLLPAAVRHGNYYKVGSVRGEAGGSLSICASGPKCGVWLEGNSNGEAGDALDLWAAVRGMKIREVLPEVRAWLGVVERQVEKPRRDYTRVSKPPKALPAMRSRVREYLVNARKLTPKIIAEFRIGEHNTKPETIAYPFIDLDGSIAMVKYIDIKRDEKGKKVVSTTSNSKPILFGMHTKLVKDSDTILICEGEIDAMSWQLKGIPAVSVPFGAKGESSVGSSPNDEWIENCFGFLDEFKTIYIAMDMDEDGDNARNDLVKRLGRDRCLVVSLPANDANECLHKGFDLASAIKKAKPLDPGGLVTGSSIAKRVADVFDRGERHLTGEVMFGWEDDFPFRLRQREGTIITGFNGHGKSNFTYMLAGWLAANGKKVFIGSYEEPAEEILSIIAQQVLGRTILPSDPALIEVTQRLLPNILIHDHEGTVKRGQFFEMATYAVKRYSAEYAFLDSLACTDVDLEDNKDVADFAKDCQAFWKRTGAHLVMLAHPRKGMTEAVAPGKMDVKGGGTMTDLFFNGITVHRLANDDTELICWKNKVGRTKPKATCHFHHPSARLTLSQSDEATEPSWLH